MVYFAQIRIGADILLVISLVFLCYRLLASGTLSGKTSQLMILEASLKGLIKDADGAGRSLNDELQRRQQSLERVLADIEAHEKRLASLHDAATRQLQEVDSNAKNAQALFARISQAAVQQQQQQPARTPVEAPEPPSFQSLAPRAEKDRHKLPARTTQRNRLNEKIERTIEPAAEVVAEAAREINQIAEDFEQIKPRNEAKEPADGRLGVLGSMKRQTQTL